MIERNVMAEMRDGVRLAADIYRPNDDGRYPVLLTRLPYSKKYGLHFLRPDVLAERGYVVIVQDVRGRFESEGEFVPYVAEVEDGYDTIEWAAGLPYSDGQVGMFGLSYYGYTQMLAAISGSEKLKVVAPVMAQNSMTDVFNDHDGALELGMWTTWNLESILPDMLLRRYRDTDQLETRMADLLQDLDGIEESYSRKPYGQYRPITRTGAMDYYDRLLGLHAEDEHWQKIDVKSVYQKVRVPGLHIAGWYDCFLDKTIANFQNGHERGLGDRLIIGPWTHANFVSYIGDRNFGVAASRFGEASMHELHLDWFDHWLKGAPEKIIPPIQYFVMGTNQWKTAKNWPLENTHFTPLYFHSNGQANTKNGDGTASFHQPDEKSPVDQFIYDPENPVPSYGGGTLHKGLHADGPQDQQQLEERADVLCYTTAPLKKELEVTGPIQVELYARTDAPNTDFTAKLVDVAPDGTAYNLTDGIIRAAKQQKAPLDNKVYKYTIDLWATSNVFLKGHQIRVEISSSNFPRFDPNPNTGGSFIDTTASRTARQQIYHDLAHPSHIILPIIK
ncbi:CocE/NonD family hydrolase [Listeria costaricensis]|uniref:CocE/NonD family hydrolase n=1 Tax=Listeria costaricensis TaxID=2026604 RepID=UPI000C073FBF|nr:CocE/NonD family hydrolase [Listeria costaricensis]